jgi:hypothetical protein
MPRKPGGYNSALPYLIIPVAEATLAFLKAVFDAQSLRRHERARRRCRPACLRAADNNDGVVNLHLGCMISTPPINVRRPTAQPLSWGRCARVMTTGAVALWS